MLSSARMPRKSPKVNHELLNIECVGAQYKKARNQVIKNLLNENDCAGYRKGTSPEAMVYRAAFVHTKNDEGCNQVCNEIEKFFEQCAGEKHSFETLYKCLQGKDYGARKGIIPLFLAKKLADTEGTVLKKYRPAALIDAILAKKNLGTTREMADLTVGLGPGFVAGEDVDYVVETMRGHNLARIITKGAAMPNTGVPGIIGGFGKERVLHAPAAGEIHCISKIADIVEKDQVLAWIGDTPVRASLTGVLRGMIRDGFTVPKGMKIADIDPRKEQKKNCFTISDKARCIAGSVLEILLSEGVMPYEAPGRFSGTAAD